jgi:hypothetical protein
VLFSASNRITLKSDEIDKVKYIIIQGADINAGSKSFVFEKPLVIQIK